jgi:methylated-DNA-[protein]-cysteine S-methyltransferase
MNSSLYRSSLETPFGDMQIGVDAEGTLLEIRLPNRGPFSPRQGRLPAVAVRTTHDAKAQLLEYFAGTRRTFDLPIDARGTAFEQMIWKRLIHIPYGTTTSCGVIAAQIGLINGARAVGRANGSNSDPNRDSVSSRNRQQWRTHRVWWRVAAQTRVA